MLSNANVSAAQAENYYEKDDYYTQGDPNQQSDSHWQGKGAEKITPHWPRQPGDIPAAPTRPNPRRKITPFKTHRSD